MGLMRMAARTAVVAGTATAVSSRVAYRQADKHAAKQQEAYDEQQQAAAAAAPAPRLRPQHRQHLPRTTR